MSKKEEKDKKDPEELSFEEEVEENWQEENSAPDKLKKLKEELKRCSAEKREYLEGWQRAKADYVNFKKEVEESRLLISKHAKLSLLVEIFPVLDSFEMAFANREAWQQAPENWRRGIEYIYNQLGGVLANNGVEKIDKTGVVFDPQIHDSVGIIDTEEEGEDNIVLEIVKTGYKIDGKVLRPASVKVGHYKS